MPLDSQGSTNPSAYVHSLQQEARPFPRNCCLPNPATLLIYPNLMADPTPAVEIRDLVKDFKTSFRRQMLRAVDGVSITIMPGEVYGLIGPNGSGKSTTMKALLGLVKPTSGSCSIFGKDSLKTDSRHDVGFLP